MKISITPQDITKEVVEFNNALNDINIENDELNQSLNTFFAKLHESTHFVSFFISKQDKIKDDFERALSDANLAGLPIIEEARRFIDAVMEKDYALLDHANMLREAIIEETKMFAEIEKRIEKDLRRSDVTIMPRKLEVKKEIMAMVDKSRQESMAKSEDLRKHIIKPAAIKQEMESKAVALIRKYIAVRDREQYKAHPKREEYLKKVIVALKELGKRYDENDFIKELFETSTGDKYDQNKNGSRAAENLS